MALKPATGTSVDLVDMPTQGFRAALKDVFQYSLLGRRGSMHEPIFVCKQTNHVGDFEARSFGRHYRSAQDASVRGADQIPRALGSRDLLDAHMDVDLRGQQGLVPQQGLNHGDVTSSVNQVGCK